MVTIMIILSLTLIPFTVGHPEKKVFPKIKNPEMGVQIPPHDWWKWQNNPLYNEYWQRDPLRRPWTSRPPTNYPFTYGPDTEYTHQIYDTPEYFGYDSTYPGGRTHFIGYKNQGSKPTKGHNGEQIPWNKFPIGPTTEIIPQFENGNNQP